MGVREIDRSMEQWRMEVKDLRRRMILARTPRERERWYAMLLLAQGWKQLPRRRRWKGILTLLAVGRRPSAREGLQP